MSFDKKLQVDTIDQPFTLKKTQGIKGLRVFCPKDYNLAWHGNHTTLFGELEKKRKYLAIRQPPAANM